MAPVVHLTFWSWFWSYYCTQFSKFNWDLKLANDNFKATYIHMYMTWDVEPTISATILTL